MNTLEKSLEGLGLLRQESFESEMNDPIIVIDKTHIPGFVRHRVHISVYNISDATLYFKILEQIPNWVINPTGEIPVDGRLGALTPGQEKHFVGLITSNMPVGEREDVGNFVIEAYPDDTYTGLIESHSHPTTIYIEDLENWANVQKFDFDDGTAQGWTFNEMSISGVISVEEGGYSAYGAISKLKGTAIATVSLLKSITLPSTSKVRLSFYWFYAFEGVRSPYDVISSYIKNLEVYVGGERIYSCLEPDSYIAYKRCNHSDVYGGWFKSGLDLSDFAGQTKDIGIYCTLYVHSPTTDTWMRTKLWIDDIIIAGK